MSCIVDGCKNIKVVAKSLCSKHYHRQHRYGSTSFVKQDKSPPAFCIAQDCKRKPKAKSLCEAHYARFKRDGKAFSTLEIRKNTFYSSDDVCIIPRCKKSPFAKLMCRQHYQQQNKHQIDFSKILYLFEDGCGTCGTHDSLSIDHDHNICAESFACSKCFRGILCGPCNRALGMVKDSPKILKRMIEYIEK